MSKHDEMQKTCPIPPDSDRALADVPEWVKEGVRQRAEQDLTAACRLMEFAKLLPTPARLGSSFAPPVQLSFLLKLGAMLRLSQWDKGRVREKLRTRLPAADEVLSDLHAGLVKSGEQYPGRELSARVFGTWYQEMAWQPLADAGADVVTSSADPETILNEIAALLWQLR